MTETEYARFINSRHPSRPPAVFANKHQNMVEHWDVSFGAGVRVDFKTQKSITRNSPIQDTRILVEHQNVRGDVGWIHGQAEWIAFERQNTILHVKRKELEALLGGMNWSSPVSGWPLYAQNYTAYRRKGRNDAFCYVPVADIQNLPSQQEISK